MNRVGVTGQAGFMGSHLFNTLGLYPDEFERIDFKRNIFDDTVLLDQFVSTCDVIVHFAGMNRHDDEQVIYDTNVNLASRLIEAAKRTGCTPQIIFSSSTQEQKDNVYGRSKREARALFQSWAVDNGGCFTGMIIPNVFGPFGRPFYNSVVATFCHQLVNSETPAIQIDSEIQLIYVGELISEVLQAIRNRTHAAEYIVPSTCSIRVSEILAILQRYSKEYIAHCVIPSLPSKFELNLFNTFRSYINIKEKFPVKYRQFADIRGSFSEVIRLNMGGQVSFSTTLPGATRGNHFHTRKIERFAVIKGEALIQLRRIGTNEVMDFLLSGNKPAFVDMPIWYVHNIKNIGNDELITIFWINEFYNSEDPDTFFETV